MKESMRTEEEKPSGPEVREGLLLQAKHEFLEQGFEKASLRKICARAGVTTGAVYFFFKNKEDLFCQIVEDTASQLTVLGQRLSEAELERPELGTENDIRLMEFLYLHREEAILLLEKSQGTRYGSFRNELYGQLQKFFLLFFQRHGRPDVDPELIRILVEMRMKGFLELLKGDYSLEYVRTLTRRIGDYADGGFQRLAASLKKEQESGV